MLDLIKALKEFEKVAIETALYMSQGCVSVAAKSLCLQRTTFIEKARRFGIDISSFREDRLPEDKDHRNLTRNPTIRIAILTAAMEEVERCVGNRTKAAINLGISVRTLRYWIKLAQEAGIPVSNAYTANKQDNGKR